MVITILTNPGQSDVSVREFSRTQVPRNVATMKTLAVVTMAIRMASITLFLQIEIDSIRSNLMVDILPYSLSPVEVLHPILRECNIEAVK